jgi:hypothetical protein
MLPSMNDSSGIGYETIDPGVRRLVRWLNDRGFATCDSGDGSKAPDMECALDVPNVSIVVADKYDLISTADRLRQDLEDIGVMVLQMGPEMGKPPSIQAGYDAGGGNAWIDLLGVSDADLPADAS